MTKYITHSWEWVESYILVILFPIRFDPKIKHEKNIKKWEKEKNDSEGERKRMSKQDVSQ
jgi:hypothetical protein